MEQKTPLENKIPESKNFEEFVYETPPEGIGAFGLQGVKNCIRTWNGVPQDAFRFIFRSRDNIKAFLNVTVSASVGIGRGKKSNLWQLLENMTGKNYEVLTKDEAFKLICDSIGHWYNCYVGHKKKTGYSASGKQEKIVYVELLSNKAKLHEKDAEWGDCHDFFPKNKTLYPDTPDDAFEGFKDNDFDVSKEYPHLYVLTGCTRIHEAIILIKGAGALQHDRDGYEWRTKEKVPQLAAYYRPTVMQDETSF